MSCPAYNPEGAFARELLTYVDCQALSIGQGGYQTLAAPGSSIFIASTGMLILFVALFGYRMVMGKSPNLADIVLAIVKVGLVLTLATNWSAYRTVFYDVTMRGPAEIASQIGGASDIPATQGGLYAYLQQTDNGLIELGRLGVGRQQNQTIQGGFGQQPGSGNGGNGQSGRGGQSTVTNQTLDLSFDRASDANALRHARTAFLVETVGALVLIRLFAGLLLALGPIFVAFLLFEATRDLFFNWVRALGWSVIGAVSTTMIIGVEIAFLNPWLASILSLRRADLPTNANPAEILAFSLIFMVAIFAVLWATARLMQRMSFSAPVHWFTAGLQTIATKQPLADSGQMSSAPEQRQRSRAATIADAASTMVKREANGRRGSTPAMAQREGRVALATQGRMSDRSTGLSGAGFPVVFRRRTWQRVSAGATNRDKAR